MSGNGKDPNPGEVQREGFAGGELQVVAETASSAVAAQAKAQIEARYIMAMQRPRDLDEVRQRLLKECDRPGFAKVARYHKPIGRGVEGPSIRFAEAALRCMGNVLAETATVYDDDTKRIVRVSLTDLESNLTIPKDVTISKTVERRSLDGKTPISSRTNSHGQTVYTIAATDDDILNKENALISKAMRTNGLRLLPGDILEECMERVDETLRKGIKDDPDKERKKLVDAYGKLGVKAPALKAYLGHDLDQSSPAELMQLRSLYAAIRDGEATWTEAMDSRGASSPAEESQKAKDLKDKLAKSKLGKRKKAAKKAEAPASSPDPQPPEAPASEGQPDGPDKMELDAYGNCLRCERGANVLADFGHGSACK